MRTDRSPRRPAVPRPDRDGDGTGPVRNVMTSRRLAAVVIAVALAGTSACGGGDDRLESGDGSSLTSVAGGADTDQTASGDSGDERCDALRVLAEAQPPAASFEEDELDEFEAAYRAYAEAAERAAEASEEPERQVLADFAELMRTIGSDPATDVADEVERLSGPMQDLTSSALRECDVSFGLVPR